MTVNLSHVWIYWRNDSRLSEPLEMADRGIASGFGVWKALYLSLDEMCNGKRRGICNRQIADEIFSVIF